MAQITGDHLSKVGDSATVDTAKQHTVGKLGYGSDGFVYIYLPGVASLVVGDVVTYDPSTYATTRALSTATVCPPLAVAISAVNATTSFGWFMVRGVANVNVASTTVTGDALTLSSTASRLTRQVGAALAVDLVIGIGATANAVANLSLCYINYPWRLLQAAS